MSLTEITKELRELGIGQEVIKLVKVSAKYASRKEQGPALTNIVVSRLRKEVGTGNKAMLVLCENGEYRVFSPDGYQKLIDSAKKNKPWESAHKN